MKAREQVGEVTSEIGQLQQDAWQGAQQIAELLVLPDDIQPYLIPSNVNGDAVLSTASSLAKTHDPETAHQYAQTALADFSYLQARSIQVWSGLYKAGDESALPEAKAAIERNRQNTGGLKRSERYALLRNTARYWRGLFEAGDSDSVGPAREAAQRSILGDRALHYAMLYRAGDPESFDWALREMSKTRGASRNRVSLVQNELAPFLLAEQKALEGDAESASSLLKRADLKGKYDYYEARVHMALFERGVAESTYPLLSFLENTKSNVPEFTTRLIKMGYEPIVTQAKRRAADKEDSSYLKMCELPVLHEIGDPTAAPEILRIKRARTRDEDLSILSEVGLHHERVALVEESYAKNPSRQNDIQVLEAEFSRERWLRIFGTEVQGGSINRAARHLGILATHVTKLRSPAAT